MLELPLSLYWRCLLAPTANTNRPTTIKKRKMSRPTTAAATTTKNKNNNSSGRFDLQFNEVALVFFYKSFQKKLWLSASRLETIRVMLWTDVHLPPGVKKSQKSVTEVVLKTRRLPRLPMITWLVCGFTETSANHKGPKCPKSSIRDKILDPG